MTELSIYIDRGDRKTVEEEEKQKFIRNVIEAISIPGFEDVWPEEAEVGPELKIAVRAFLKDFDLDIVEGIDGSVVVYSGDDEIAIWEKPSYVLRVDNKAKRHSEKTYFEMKIKFWSMWDEEEES